MFGFGKKKKQPQPTDQRLQDTQPRHAAAQGYEEPSPEASQSGSDNESGVPAGVPAHVVANATQMVAAATGLDTYHVGETLWLQAPAMGLNEFQFKNLDLRIDISVSDQGVPVHHVVMDWYGVQNDFGLAEFRYLCNSWNNEYAAPRLYCYEDEQGWVRLRGDIVMPWHDGYTLAQLSSFLHNAVEMAMLLSEWLEETWPDVQVAFPDPSEYPSFGMHMTGTQQSVEAAEKQLASLLVPGFGFQVEDTPPVTMQRIADAATSVVEHPVEMTSDGLLEINYGPFKAFIELIPAILSVRTYIDIQTSDVDSAAESLKEVIGRQPQDPDGSVATVYKDSAGNLEIICARHVFTNGGMTDHDVALTVAKQCDVVLQCFGRIIKELESK